MRSGVLLIVTLGKLADSSMFSNKKVALILEGIGGGQLCSAEVSSIVLRQRQLTLAIPFTFVNLDPG